MTTGDVIATQDSAKLELAKSSVKTSRNRVKTADSEAELQAEEELLGLYQAQAALLAGEQRAEGLVTDNALAADAAEVAFNTDDSQYLAFDPSIINSTNKSTTKIYRS